MSTLVVGFGKSGKYASALLLSLGRKVIAIDAKAAALRVDPTLFSKNLDLFQLLPEDADLPWHEIKQLILSPGITPLHPAVEKARSLGILVRGEVEWGLENMPLHTIVGITGSNGKTTTCYLTEHVLLFHGFRAKAVGNVGYSVCQYAMERKEGSPILVMELSSYQLEMLSTPFLDEGVILNMTPNHLDRYPDMTAYVKAKIQMLLCMKPGRICYVEKKAAHDFSRELSGCSFHTFPQETDGDQQTLRQALVDMKVAPHDIENATAAWLLIRKWIPDVTRFLEAYRTFKKPSHRMEWVATIQGVQFYNDSKGTSIDATLRAIEGMTGPTYLIAGGVHKGSSYTPWIPAMRGKVRKIFVLGQAAEIIESELKEEFSVERVHTLEEATRLAFTHAKEGENVLLSPGCASTDMFENYAHRGEEFKKFINQLSVEKIS